MSNIHGFFPLEEHGDDMLAADGEAIFRNFEVRGPGDRRIGSSTSSRVFSRKWPEKTAKRQTLNTSWKTPTIHGFQGCSFAVKKTLGVKKFPGTKSTIPTSPFERRAGDPISRKKLDRCRGVGSPQGRRGGETGGWVSVEVVKCGEKRGWLVGLWVCLLQEHRFLVKRSCSVVYN